MPAPRQTPTKAQFAAFEQQFTYFNDALFGGQLPSCILNFSRQANTLGFFAPERWQHEEKGEVRHEISLNPSHLASLHPGELASIIVHEMCHLWQWEFGQKKSRRGYHNEEWADKMEEVGLVPTSTGKAGGSRVGQHVRHYVDLKGRRFFNAFVKMPTEYILPWSCDEPEGRTRRGPQPASRNKVKYTCLACGANVWGKPNMHVICGDCDERFEEASGAETAPFKARVGAA
jgi:predicted SprT family Zn-dependent metalloprotease